MVMIIIKTLKLVSGQELKLEANQKVLFVGERRKTDSYTGTYCHDVVISEEVTEKNPTTGPAISPKSIPAKKKISFK